MIKKRERIHGSVYPCWKARKAKRLLTNCKGHGNHLVHFFRFTEQSGSKSQPNYFTRDPQEGFTESPFNSAVMCPEVQTYLETAVNYSPASSPQLIVHPRFWKNLINSFQCFPKQPGEGKVGAGKQQLQGIGLGGGKNTWKKKDLEKLRSCASYVLKCLEVLGRRVSKNIRPYYSVFLFFSPMYQRSQ